MARDTVWVVWLRAVNVGGRNRLPMADWREDLAAVGLTGVRTLIQSGNAVGRGAADLGATLPASLEARLAARGVRTPVILRRAEELAEALAASPFDDPDDRRVHVGFLRDLPDPEAVRGLDPDRSPGDRFVVLGRELHLHTPGGLARCRVTNAWLERQLGTPCTVRNRRTCARVLALARDA